MTQAFVNLGVTQAMSPNVGNFVHDLVEMAKAMETLPQVQQAFDLAVKRNDELAQTVQERELAIIGYKEQIEGLHSRVRSLEVERDDASFRVLEAEDREHGILLLARNMQNDLAVIMNRLDPPKPQPEPEKEPEHVAVHKWDDEPKDQSVTDPTANTMTTNSSETASSASNQDTAHTSTSEEAPKSDANPPESSSTGSGDGSTHGESSKGTSEDREPSDKYSDEWYDWRQREDKRQGYHRF